MTQDRGSPQGSVLGPLFWLLIAEQFLQELPSLLTPDMLVLAFADDFIFVVSASSWKTLPTLLQQLTDIFQRWLNDNKLTLSQQKTSVTLITKKNNRPPKIRPTFKISGSNIKHTKTFKFLGLIFNGTLTWGNHIQYIREKLLNIVSSWAIVGSKSWGVRTSHFRTWFMAVVERIMVYGAGIWGKQLTITNKQKLLSIQRPFLLKIAKAYHTTSSSALQVLCGVLPAHLAVLRECLLSQVLRQGETITTESGQYNPKDISVKLPVSSLHPTLNYYTDFVLLNTDTPIHLGSYHIYTDGSKRNNRVGSAFAVFHLGVRICSWSRRLSDHATVFQAELLAIQEAINWCLREGSPAVIFSDSRSSLQALLNPLSRDGTVQDTQQQLVHIRTTGLDLTLRWVKAHSGLEGNEFADELAGQATDRPQVQAQVPLPISYIKKTLLRDIQTLWQREWDETSTGRYTYFYHPKVQLHLQTTTAAHTVFITNHGPFPEYLHRIRRANSPDCLCDAPGNALHYLTQCPLTSRWHIRVPTDQNKTIWVKQLRKNKFLAHRLSEIHEWLSVFVDYIKS